MIWLLFWFAWVGFVTSTCLKNDRQSFCLKEYFGQKPFTVENKNSLTPWLRHLKLTESQYKLYLKSPWDPWEHDKIEERKANIEELTNELNQKLEDRPIIHNSNSKELALLREALNIGELSFQMFTNMENPLNHFGNFAKALVTLGVESVNNRALIVDSLFLSYSSLYFVLKGEMSDDSPYRHIKSKFHGHFMYHVEKVVKIHFVDKFF
eukprot:GHVL01042151.1.p1 GENE.GHVL01042151.1~~GHVL01042151.1.p1  ORF type:complete len:219 (+),score=24.64 GHVL01042151.1:31-657(+)